MNDAPLIIFVGSLKNRRIDFRCKYVEGADYYISVGSEDPFLVPDV